MKESPSSPNSYRHAAQFTHPVILNAVKNLIRVTGLGRYGGTIRWPAD